MDLHIRSLIRRYRQSPTDDELAHQIARAYARMTPDPSHIEDMEVAQCLLSNQPWFVENENFADEVPDHIDAWLTANCCFSHRRNYEFIVYIGEPWAKSAESGDTPDELKPAIAEAIGLGFKYICFYID